MTKDIQKPVLRPHNPCFSSGPCAKRPGWSVDILSDALWGRSHRSKPGKEKLHKVITETKQLLGIPEEYKVAIMPGSDTGAIEAALWSLLGPRPVDVLAWDSFGAEWAQDCLKQLKPLQARALSSEFGKLPDLHQVNFDHDVVFTWNGTTSGVIIPNGEWIADDRKGLTLCDATSAVFAVPLPWGKLDVVTFSWQKALGGEAQHGMLVLSPRAVDRLESHVPAWPIPKLFRLTKNGKLDKEIVEGSTINTPSMLCVEDVLDSLAWVKASGGAKEMERRTAKNFGVLARWIDRTEWLDFLASDPSYCSPTSVCLCAGDATINAFPQEKQSDFFKRVVALLEQERAAYDIGSYKSAPPGLRIWCGATVEASDLEALIPWIEWAYATIKKEMENENV